MALYPNIESIGSTGSILPGHFRGPGPLHTEGALSTHAWAQRIGCSPGHPRVEGQDAARLPVVAG